MTKKNTIKASLDIPKEAPKLVLVVWEDATQLSHTPWMDPDDIKYDPRIFRHVGFMMYDGPEAVILAEAWSKDSVANPTQIPRGMIKKIQYIQD